MARGKIQDNIQNQFNQTQFFSWLNDPKTLALRPKTVNQYKGTTELFLLFLGNCSILDVKLDTIKKFKTAPVGKKPQDSYKPSRQLARINYLQKFLQYIDKNHSREIKWDFTIKELKTIHPSKKEVADSTESAKPLSFQEFISLHKEFEKRIGKDKEWLKAYLVFRLMFNYGLDKVDIEKISNSTYSIETGLFTIQESGRNTNFDHEIMGIFKTEGIDFISRASDTIYLMLEPIWTFLNKAVTQEVIRETKKNFLIKCPYCGELIENNTDNFGFLKSNTMNLNGLILCKSCLEKPWKKISISLKD